MNMKKKSGSISLTVLLLTALLFQQCTNANKDHQMHNAQIIMDDEINIEQLINSPNKTVLSKQATVKLNAHNGTQTIKAQGYIDFDRNSNQSVSARFGGRIEKLFVKYEFQYVKKGDKILEIYSPELNTFQEEHLFLLKSAKEQPLLEQSRQKLKLFGITDNQISQLEKSERFTQTITVYSPSDGYVLFNSETNGNAGSIISEQTSTNSMVMNEKNNADKSFGSSNSQIREGIYLNKGEIIFSINNLKNVWAIVSVSSEFNSVIQNSSHVKLISELFPDKQLTGVIALIEQTFEDNNQRFIRVRINIPNSKGELKINSLVTAEIPVMVNGNFQIPATAVYRTGLNSYVWLKIGTTKSGTGIFQLKKVSTGAITGGLTTVISGISANQEVAEFAGTLTDSETFLNEN